jgi:DNA/RNA endonuclease YhcR with UshA esterase domain
MDNDRGQFEALLGTHFQEMLEDAQRTGNTSRVDKVFSEGETVQIKGSRFIVRSIDHISGILTLKLLPQKKDEELRAFS